ncbi:hypothetical protein RSOLAG1IB_07253 [Rhizoctonia solani AG-1 IB]|uniref:N-acetyltransferase domain-containing protein n=1 Tax=Thanatephorus cucumeris (strain AG1-IB / isolate 7/3/14) TaxID=1108050 RepID=A0A0B7FCT9_THACB|nr:hypothetical protein RSOLAG1IB_07253 [Rhizoctonia solani AG-1 IB]
MAEPSSGRLEIRTPTLKDIPDLYRICLLTANAGDSAESLHQYPEVLQGLYIEPYLRLPTTFGFVLVGTSDEGKEAVLGYLLGTSNSRRHEAAAEQESYPPLRIKYPNNPYPPGVTERDQTVINRIHKPLIRPQGLVDISPAHIHINLLPQAQKKGWGRKLINEAVKTLKTEGQSSLFVGIDSKNHNSRAFYLRIGFKPFPFPDKEYFILDFQDWNGP